jgi:7,8-dihydropterin-6-yl-methyl-4-(beta-D-ribofuranosyl)aminobenzene 5'-phosphate synthase
MVRSVSLLAVILALPMGESLAAEPTNRVTILYDAFGKDSAMKKDWGFSALVEYGGRRVLFDTGNNAEVFATNVKAAGIDLSKLDFVVISHRHLDHTAGLSHLLSVNPNVRIYVPEESIGGEFGTSKPGSFYRKAPSLPQDMRYFDGKPPELIVLGTPWVGGRFESVPTTREVAPGMTLISTVSEIAGTKEMRELSLALRTPEGTALVVGCSHPGIERIVESAAALDKRVRIVLGGFHLPAASDEEISRIAATLHDRLKVEKLAPGHCTGEPAFALFQRTWGRDYFYAGLGSAIALP